MTDEFGEMVETTLLLSPPEGKCQECATEHEPHLPHNAQSLFYQVRFHLEHGRYPDWRDALAHCSAEMKALWIDGLAKAGVDVEAGQINPEKRKRKARGETA